MHAHILNNYRCDTGQGHRSKKRVCVCCSQVVCFRLKDSVVLSAVFQVPQLSYRQNYIVDQIHINCGLIQRRNLSLFSTMLLQVIYMYAARSDSPIRHDASCIRRISVRRT